MGAGKLQDKYSKYTEYLKFVRWIGLNDSSLFNNIKDDLRKQTSNLLMEKGFVAKGQTDAQIEYKNIQGLPKAPEKSFFAVAWKVESSRNYWRKT